MKTANRHFEFEIRCCQIVIGNLCNKNNRNSGRLWPFVFWPLDLNLLKKVRNVRRTGRTKLSTQMPPIYFYTKDSTDKYIFVQSS